MKKTDLTFCFGKICHYFILNGRLPILTFYRQRIDESLLLGKEFLPKNSNHDLRMLSLLVSLYFLVLICYALSIMLQTQRQSYLIAD